MVGRYTELKILTLSGPTLDYSIELVRSRSAGSFSRTNMMLSFFLTDTRINTPALESRSFSIQAREMQSGTCCKAGYKDWSLLASDGLRVHGFAGEDRIGRLIRGQGKTLIKEPKGHRIHEGKFDVQQVGFQLGKTLMLGLGNWIAVHSFLLKASLVRDSSWESSESSVRLV